MIDRKCPKVNWVVIYSDIQSQSIIYNFFLNKSNQYCYFRFRFLLWKADRSKIPKTRIRISYVLENGFNKNAFYSKPFRGPAMDLFWDPINKKHYYNSCCQFTEKWMFEKKICYRLTSKSVNHINTKSNQNFANIQTCQLKITNPEKHLNWNQSCHWFFKKNYTSCQSKTCKKADLRQVAVTVFHFQVFDMSKIVF